MSTSINCVTKHKDILLIAEVRGDGGNTTGYNSTSTEYYTTDMFIVLVIVWFALIPISFITLTVEFYKRKDIFFTTF
jgi:hypothetical protein